MRSRGFARAARSKRALVGVAALATFGTFFANQAAKAQSPYAWAANLPGCSQTPAIATNAKGQVLNPQPAGAPVPCGVSTGWPTVEQKIMVLNDGSLWYEPALQGGAVLSGDGHVPGDGNEMGYATSSDSGAIWKPAQVLVSNPDTHVLDSQVDNYIYVDNKTGRMFWYMQDSGNLSEPHAFNNCGTNTSGDTGATVAYSDNDGSAWSWGYDLDHECAENPNVITARSTIPGEHLSYPDVVYLCGDNFSSGEATVGTPGYSCSKSLNGGASWLGTTLDDPLGPEQAFYSGDVKDATDPYPQCAGQSSTGGSDVQPLPDGTLVTVVTCNNDTFLSESTDEGATWKITNQIPNGGVLRLDSAGNMYLVNCAACTGGLMPSLPASNTSSGNSELLLSSSTNGGKTWSPEENMTAPGVTSIGTWWFATGTFASGLVGDVSVAYYGIDPKNGDGKNSYSDGFITATRDALDGNPVFWSGQVNPTGSPLLYNTSTDGNIGVTVLDFNGGSWSPDGHSAWGSWVQDCGVNIATSPGCTSRYPHYNPANPDTGYAGRLLWPPANR